MQKIFRKYMILITTAAILSILVIHYHLSMYFLESQQLNTFNTKISQIIRTLEANRSAQASAQSGPDEDYLTIFSKFPTGIGEEFFAIHVQADKVIAHSDGVLSAHLEKYYRLEVLSGCENGSYKKMADNQINYVVTRHYGNVLIGASIPKNILRGSLWKNMLSTLAYLLLFEAIIIVLLNYLVKRKVVDGVHSILQSLSEITNGNLGTTVMVGGNPEFLELSDGINTMVKGIVNASDRTSKIIGMSRIPLAAFEYQESMKHVFITPGLKDLLDLSAEDISVFRENADMFYEKIQEIMKNPLSGWKDIFQISETKYVHIRLTIESDGYLGTITDVTKDVLDKRRILYENSHDQLTGLYKYKCFKELAADILSQMPSGEISAFIMLDLDSFKNINDTYGHDTGDIYLQSFASIMEAMPKEHCLASRRSGDEFCMMLFGCRTINDVTGLLDSFFQLLEDKKIELPGSQIQSIKASAGFSCTDSPVADVSVLLHQADHALYNAKKGNKGNYAEYISGR